MYKNLVNTIVGVLLTAALLSVGALWSQVSANRAEISGLKEKVDLAVKLLFEIKEDVRAR